MLFKSKVIISRTCSTVSLLGTQFIPDSFLTFSFPIFPAMSYLTEIAQIYPTPACNAIGHFLFLFHFQLISQIE